MHLHCLFIFVPFLLFVLVSAASTVARGVSAAERTISLDKDTPNHNVFSPSPDDSTLSDSDIWIVTGYLLPNVHVTFSGYKCEQFLLRSPILFPGAGVTVQNVEAGQNIAWEYYGDITSAVETCSPSSNSILPQTIPAAPDGWSDFSEANRVTIRFINNRIHGATTGGLYQTLELPRWAALWVMEPIVCGYKKTPTVRSAGSSAVLDLEIAGNIIDFAQLAANNDSSVDMAVSMPIFGITALPNADDLSSAYAVSSPRIRNVTIVNNVLTWPYPNARADAAANLLLVGIEIGKVNAVDDLRSAGGDHRTWTNPDRFIGLGSDVSAGMAMLSNPDDLANAVAGKADRKTQRTVSIRGNKILHFVIENAETGGIRFGTFGSNKAAAVSFDAMQQTLGQARVLNLAFAALAESMKPHLVMEISDNVVNCSGIGLTDAVYINPLAVVFESQVIVRRNKLSASRLHFDSRFSTQTATRLTAINVAPLRLPGAGLWNLTIEGNELQVHFPFIFDANEVAVSLMAGVSINMNASATGADAAIFILRNTFTALRLWPTTSAGKVSFDPDHNVRFIDFLVPPRVEGDESWSGFAYIPNITIAHNFLPKVRTSGFFSFALFYHLNILNFIHMSNNTVVDVLALAGVLFVRVEFTVCETRNCVITIESSAIRYAEGEDFYFVAAGYELAPSYRPFFRTFIVRNNIVTRAVCQEYSPGGSRSYFVFMKEIRGSLLHVDGNRIATEKFDQLNFVAAHNFERIFIAHNDILSQSTESLALLIMNQEDAGPIIQTRRAEIRGNIFRGQATGIILFPIMNGDGGIKGGLRNRQQTMKQLDLEFISDSNEYSAVARLQPGFKANPSVPFSAELQVNSAVFSPGMVVVDRVIFRNDTFLSRNKDIDRFFFAGGSIIREFVCDKPCSRWYRSASRKSKNFEKLSSNVIAVFEKQPILPVATVMLQAFGPWHIEKIVGDCIYSGTKTKSALASESSEITASRALTVSSNITQSHEITETPFDYVPEKDPILAGGGMTAAVSLVSLFAGPSVALDGGRALSLLATVRRCRNYKEAEAVVVDAHREHAEKTSADKSKKIDVAGSLAVLTKIIVELKEKAARDFVRKEVAFPESLIAGAPVGTGDASILRGAVLGGFIFIVLVLCAEMLLAVITAFRDRRKRWRKRQERIEGREIVREAAREEAARSRIKNSNNNDNNNNKNHNNSPRVTSTPPATLVLSSSSSDDDNNEKNDDGEGQELPPLRYHPQTGRVIKPSFLQFVGSRKNVLQHARLPYACTIAVSLQLSMWLPAASVFLVSADKGSFSAADRFFYGVIPIVGCWLAPSLLFCFYLQHAALSRAYEKHNGGEDGGRFLSWIKRPMKREDAFQIEQLYIRFPAARNAAVTFGLTISPWKLRIYNFLEAAFGEKSSLGRGICFGEYVWSQGSTKRSVAQGEPGSFLRQCGSIVNKYYGPMSAEALLEMDFHSKKEKNDTSWRENRDESGNDNNNRREAMLRSEYDPDQNLSRGITDAHQPLRFRLAPFSVYINSVWSAAAALAQTVAALHPGRCSDVLIVMVVVGALALTFSCLVRPFIAPLRNAAQIIADTCFVVACCIAVFALLYADIDVAAIKANQPARSAGSMNAMVSAATGILLAGVIVLMIGSLVHGVGKFLTLSFVQQIALCTKAEWSVLRKEEERVALEHDASTRMETWRNYKKSNSNNSGSSGGTKQMERCGSGSSRHRSNRQYRSLSDEDDDEEMASTSSPAFARKRSDSRSPEHTPPRAAAAAAFPASLVPQRSSPTSPVSPSSQPHRSSKTISFAFVSHSPPQNNNNNNNNNNDRGGSGGGVLSSRNQSGSFSFPYYTPSPVLLGLSNNNNGGSSRRTTPQQQQQPSAFFGNGIQRPRGASDRINFSLESNNNRKCGGGTAAAASAASSTTVTPTRPMPAILSNVAAHLLQPRPLVPTQSSGSTIAGQISKTPTVRADEI